MKKTLTKVAAAALPFALGLALLAEPASAEQNTGSTPKSCTWGGTTYSSGAGKTTTSGTSWKHYTCTDGVWVLDSSCSGNCNPPPADSRPPRPPRRPRPTVYGVSTVPVLAR